MTTRWACFVSIVSGFSLCFAALFFPDVTGSEAKGKIALEIPKGFAGIFAYGSLISRPSMEASLGHKYEGPLHEVHLKGYERVWACVRPWNDPRAGAASTKKLDGYILRDSKRLPILGAAELNLFPSKEGRINGVLFLVTDEELRKFDEREWGYRRVDVTGKIEEFNFRGGNVYAYEGSRQSRSGSPGEKGTYILIKEFLDAVMGACDTRGKSFRDEFDASTKKCTYPIVSSKDIIWEKAK